MLRSERRPSRSLLAKILISTCLILAAGVTPAFAEAFFLPTGDEVHNTGDPRLVVDVRGGMHLTYPLVAAQGVVYAYCAADCTSEERFETVTFYTDEFGGVDTALVAVDPAGRPHLLFSSHNAVMYATCEDPCGTTGQWESRVVFEHDGDWELTGDAFALDPQGRPRFLMHAYQAYLGIGQPEEGTMYFQCDQACADARNWTASVISEQSWLESTLRFDAQGTAHVATVIPVDDVELVAYLACSSDCGNEEVDNWPGLGLTMAYSDRYVAEIAPAVSLAVGTDGGVRLAFLGADGEENFLGYYECLADCTEPDGSTWEGLILLHSSDGSDLGDGLALVLDQRDRPRLAYTSSSSILVAYCDGDCVGRSGPDDWALVEGELASDIPADDIFLYYNCNVGFWFLRQPALALQQDGLPVVAYRAEDKSGGWTSPDPTKPSCPAGVDMTMTRLSVLDSY